MQGITIRALGPEDLAVLCAVPEGLFDEDIRPDQAEAFLVDPAQNTITLRRADPDLVSAMASLIWSSGQRPEISSSSFSRPCA
jgi:hypothetical protein